MLADIRLMKIFLLYRLIIIYKIAKPADTFIS